MSTIVIAEDSATQRQLLQITLERGGYRVRIARDGEEALRLALDGEPPDLVLTDLAMPRMDGCELCRRVKAEPRLRRVPVVVLTELADPRDLIAALQCGADSFVGKPFGEDYLLSRLREVLTNHELPEREQPEGVQVSTGGETYTIDASRPQILDLLLSVYDAALRRNRELQLAERQLTKLNRELERKFKDREQLLENERAARAEAERANRMKEEFLATVSHELRTPLSAISGWAQFLRQGSPTREELNEALEVIERNAWAQTQIVEDLLDMSRIESGKLRLEVREVNLRAVVNAAIDTVRAAAEARGVQLEASLEDAVPRVRADEARLQQVLWNLLSNAVKFTPAGGSVRAAVAPAAGGVDISITDTGAGIEPEFLPHVFDRFRQSDATITRKHGGLGLGLSIVKNLVELHGGNVRVGSPGTGRGSTFTVWLPPAPPQEDAGAEYAPTAALPAPVEAPPARQSGVRLEGVRVLVVDDEPDARTLLRRLLGDRGAQVDSADSVVAALECLSRSSYDVLVSDIGMPKEDGYTLIQRVRALPPDKGGRTPALALTAYARQEDRAKATRAGYRLHLTKPVDTVQLIDKVATLAGVREEVANGSETATTEPPSHQG